MKMAENKSLNKKTNYLDLNTAMLEEKLKEEKAKLLSTRADIANRKLKNVKQVSFQRKEIARLLFFLGQKKKADVSVKEKVMETK